MKKITAAELRLRLIDQLADLHDDDEVFFGSGDLSLYRVKDRGPVTGRRLVQIEFNEAYSIQADPDSPN